MTSKLILVALAGVLATCQAAPSTCALYYDFRNQTKSNMYFGMFGKDGTPTRRADLGPRDDPTGKWTISEDGSSFAFATDYLKHNEHYGCCDPPAVMSVNMLTGENKLSKLGRLFPVKGAKCGIWGCGFLTIGNYNSQSKKLTGWVEALVHVPPPSAATEPTVEQIRGQSQDVGMTFVEFNMETEEAEATQSFALNAQTDPLMNAGGTSVYDEDGNMWFPCCPSMSDFKNNTQAVCHASSSRANTPSKANVMKWSNKNISITAIEYSKVLKSPIVLAQGLDLNANMTVVKTAIYKAGGDWPLLVDLGTTTPGLHQTTMSPDGKYMVVWKTDAGSKEERYPPIHLVTVDMVAKKVVNTIDVLGEHFGILAAMPCGAGEAEEQTLVV